MESTVSKTWDTAQFRAAAWRWFAGAMGIEPWGVESEESPEDPWPETPERKLAALLELNPEDDLQCRKFYREHVLGWGDEEPLEEFGSNGLKNARDLVLLVVDALMGGPLSANWEKIWAASSAARDERMNVMQRRTKILEIVDYARECFPAEPLPVVEQCGKCHAWGDMHICACCGAEVKLPDPEVELVYDRHRWAWRVLSLLHSVDEGFNQLRAEQLVNVVSRNNSTSWTAATLCMDAGVFGDGKAGSATERRRLQKLFSEIGRKAKWRKKLGD